MMERVLGPLPTHMLQKTRQVYTLTLTACYHSLVHGVSVCVYPVTGNYHCYCIPTGNADTSIATN